MFIIYGSVQYVRCDLQSAIHRFYQTVADARNYLSNPIVRIRWQPAGRSVSADVKRMVSGQLFIRCSKAETVGYRGGLPLP